MIFNLVSNYYCATMSSGCWYMVPMPNENHLFRAALLIRTWPYQMVLANTKNSFLLKSEPLVAFL